MKKQRAKEAWFDSGTAAFGVRVPGRTREWPFRSWKTRMFARCAAPVPAFGLTEGYLTFEDARRSRYGGKPVA